MRRATRTGQNNRSHVLESESRSWEKKKRNYCSPVDPYRSGDTDRSSLGFAGEQKRNNVAVNRVDANRSRQTSAANDWRVEDKIVDTARPWLRRPFNAVLVRAWSMCCRPRNSRWRHSLVLVELPLVICQYLQLPRADSSLCWFCSGEHINYLATQAALEEIAKLSRRHFDYSPLFLFQQKISNVIGVEFVKVTGWLGVTASSSSSSSSSSF